MTAELKDAIKLAKYNNMTLLFRFEEYLLQSGQCFHAAYTEWMKRYINSHIEIRFVRKNERAEGVFEPKVV